MFWSGIRTRDSRFIGPMLYPTELSSGGRTGFEPAADGLRRCSTSELPSSRNTFSHASAYATAAPRAPDGTLARTAVACSIDAPHCRLSPTGNPCARRLSCNFPLPPASSIATQHGCASWWNSATARHVPGPRCPDVRRRMLRKRVRAGKTAARNRSRRDGSRAFRGVDR